MARVAMAERLEVKVGGDGGDVLSRVDGRAGRRAGGPRNHQWARSPDRTHAAVMRVFLCSALLVVLLFQTTAVQVLTLR